MSVTNYRNVGFIGLGNMGYPMVQNLAKKLPDATKVIIFDLNAQAMETLKTEYPSKIMKGKNAQEVFRQSVSSPPVLDQKNDIHPLNLLFRTS